MGWFSDILKTVAGPAAAFLGGPLLGAVTGAGLGLLTSKKSGDNNTTTQQGVPSWLEGPYKDYLAQMKGLTGQPFSPYIGQGVADLTQPSLEGVDLARFRALNGAPDLNQARGMTMDVTGGKYLDNPYLNNDYTNKVIGDNANQMARSFAEGTAAQNDAGFNRAGAYGGSAWANKQSSDAEGLARQIGSMANQYQLGRTTLGAGDYRSGTGQMLTGGQLAGNLSQDDWQAINSLGQAGNTLQNNQQAKNDFEYQQYLRAQGWPIDMAKLYGSSLGQVANPFGNSTLQQPGQSPWANAIGGAAVGGVIGNSLFPSSPGIGSNTGQYGGFNSNWGYGDYIDSQP